MRLWELRTSGTGICDALWAWQCPIKNAAMKMWDIFGGRKFMFVCFLGSGHFLRQCSKESGQVKYSSSSQNPNLASSHSPSQTQCVWDSVGWPHTETKSKEQNHYISCPALWILCLSLPLLPENPSSQAFPLHHLSVKFSWFPVWYCSNKERFTVHSRRNPGEQEPQTLDKWSKGVVESSSAQK